MADSFDRLCEIAVRDQWRLEDLDWRGLDVSSLPLAFRQNAADAFAQLGWGERTARDAAERLRWLLPAGAARTFVEIQVKDEARHVAFFDRAIELCGCPGRVRPSVRRLMREVEEAETPEALALGMQILIEGVGHSLFLEAASLVGALLGEGDGDGGGGGAAAALAEPLRAVRTVVGTWMPRLLARDESRHIAFGLSFLRDRIPRLAAPDRARLEDRIADWGQQVRAQARDPDLVDGVGVDGRALCGRLIDDLNLRIGQVGLTTRIAAPAPADPPAGEAPRP